MGTVEPPPTRTSAGEPPRPTTENEDPTSGSAARRYRLINPVNDQG